MLPHLTSTYEEFHSLPKVFPFSKLVRFQKQHESVPSFYLHMIFSLRRHPFVQIGHFLFPIAVRSKRKFNSSSICSNKAQLMRTDLQTLPQEDTMTKRMLVHGATASGVKILELCETRGRQLTGGPKEACEGCGSKINTRCSYQSVLTQTFESNLSIRTPRGWRRG